MTNHAQAKVRELSQSDAVMISAADAASIIGADPAWIRYQAHNAPEKLGFPVVVIKRRVKIPRLPFLRYLGLVTTAATEPIDASFAMIKEETYEKY